MLEQRLFVLRVVVLGVLVDIAKLSRDPDAVRDLAALLVLQVIDLLLQLLVPLGRKNYFLHRWGASSPR